MEPTVTISLMDFKRMEDEIEEINNKVEALENAISSEFGIRSSELLDRVHRKRKENFKRQVMEGLPI